MEIEKEEMKEVVKEAVLEAAKSMQNTPSVESISESKDVNIRAAKNGYLLQVGYRDTFVFTQDQKQEMLDKIIENLK